MTAEPIKTAAELVDWLFTNSLGERAELISFHSRSAVLAKVEELLASQWRPISEAPRDHPVIVAVENGVGEAWFEVDDDNWYWANNCSSDSWGGPIHPTHFRLLPPKRGSVK